MPLDYGETQAVSALSGNAVLIWIKEDGTEMRFPIFAAVTTIGRDATNMIPINDGTISRFHAKLFFQNGQYVLVDLGSANKTYVNGQEIRELPLQSGSEIRFAQQRFVFQAIQPAVPPPPQPYYAAPPMPQPPPMPMQAPPMGGPPMGAPPMMGVPPMGTPYRPPAVMVSRPKKKPKPIILLGGAFVVLLVLIVVIAKMTQKPETPASPATRGKQGPAQQSTAPVTSPPQISVPVPAQQTPTTVPVPPTGPTTPPDVTTPAATGPQAVGRMMDEAAALESAGKLREAKQRYEQALAADPTNSRARSRLEDLKQQLNDAINLHFKNAKQAYDYLRFDEAIDEWNIVLSLADPTDSRYAESQRGIQQAQARLKR